MTEFYVKVGDSSTFSKTVGEYDVYSFAGITGDFSPNHTNKSYMEKSSYGRLQAHGALMVGYMSTASTLAIAHTRAGRGRDAGLARLRPHPLSRAGLLRRHHHGRVPHQRDRRRTPSLDRRHHDQEPGRHAGRGRHAHPQMGQERGPKLMKTRLDGQVAIVTGAARGIGLGIAKLMAERGAKVVVWDRDLAPLQCGRLRAGRRARRSTSPSYASVEAAFNAARGATRQGRHPGQQCGHQRTDRADLGVPAGRLGPGRGDRHDVGVLRQPPRRQTHAREQVRAHRHGGVDRRQGRRAEHLRLFGREGRRDRLLQGAWQKSWQTSA